MSLVTNSAILLKLFPYLKDKEDVSKLKIDSESLHYISVRAHADRITGIIKQYTDTMPSVNILDVTAGVGGNILSFAKNFNHVTAVEIDKVRVECLQCNLLVYDISNVTVVHGDSVKFIETLPEDIKFNVVFIDPPWGGRSYKTVKCMRLNFGDTTLEQFINNIFTHIKPELIVVKLPLNYDIDYLVENTDGQNIYVHTLHKMQIILLKN